MTSPETNPHSPFDPRVVSAVVALIILCIGALGATLWYDHHAAEKSPPLEAIVEGYTQEMHQTLGALSHRLEALEHSLQELKQAPPPAPPSEQTLSPQDLTLFIAAITDLEQHIALRDVVSTALSGAPFDHVVSRALHLFKNQEPVTQLLAPLLPLSENGTPTPLILIEWFHFSLYHAPGVPVNSPATEMAPDAPWWTRLWGATRNAFRNLIHIRRVEETTDGLPPPASEALHLAITRALAEDRLQDALDMASRLPEAEQRLLIRWANAVHERLTLLALLGPLNRLMISSQER